MPLPPGQANPWPGIVLFTAGFAMMAFALLGGLGALPTWPLVAAGVFLALLGVVMAIREFTRPPPAPPPKPAHVTFMEKQRHTLPPPPRLEPAAAELSPTGPRKVTPIENAIRQVDEELKDVMKELGRAKVLFGTGKLSSDGYRTYTRDLESKRATLEATRARLMMEQDKGKGSL